MLAGPIVAAATFLADGGNSPADVDPTTGHGPEWGKAGPTGLLTIVLLCVALYFLIKSMNRNLKKVPESFGAPKVPVAAGAAPAAGVAGAESAEAASADPAVSDADSSGPDPRPTE